MSAFPPQRTVASMPVSQNIALKYLSTYLEAAKSSPHLLPNARLEPSGPTAGSSNASITIHNLQRVEAGLRGERLGPAVELEENNVPIADGMDDGTNKGEGNVEGEGWVNLAEYQRDQSVEGGTAGDNPTAEEMDSDLEAGNEKRGKDEGEAAAYGAMVSGAGEEGQKVIDKKARKAEKKARLKEEKRDRSRKRAAKSEHSV
ncbi:uncharacterized protein L3040_007853 [Drepanopeziza brunnea f. sp. 'multigermtubi']|uniref:Uncharacterized protein n=1 Tax=Marssonina brunnea f. sp. multigermtubi (strain MB_m1) TaxID=1072389 RepID=K1WPB7_MARBU|nr:uncharacterized protein MBM_07824 [Drepanopeziza brunnea f. sp. 'multigermtubi' MB_m1]EKD14147.1 hypothetical protein MBM_07824 [Drepanopeziza brunnea f. sp. 'multigermtubi' MB_m1]KAJ5035383.1 hypothetical protein L3040_007853 [Drepanopeziza brunnea f. sp. 'multigermtubi']